MKRVVKKRNGKKTVSNNYKVAFAVVFVLYLVSSILLKNYNIDLNRKLQIIQKENTKINNSNQTLKIKIDELSSFERMSNIAQKKGLQNREGAIKNVK